MRAVASQLKRGLVDLYWTFRGPYIRVPAFPPEPQSALFVCKGNICRSPFAEYFASKLEREGAFSRIKFGSAGLHVRKPLPAPEHAICVARQFGIDLENHRSQPISLNLVESYDMILAMEVWQYAELRSSFPLHHEKMFLLPLLDPDGVSEEKGYATFNIRDPYGGEPSAFEKCFERISRCVRNTFVVTKRERCVR